MSPIFACPVNFSRSSPSIRIPGIPDKLPDLKGITLAGRFLLRKRLGVGSFGIVYLASDIGTGALRALKIMYKDHPHSLRYRHQLREIKLHQQVSDHPNIVTLHEVIDDDEYFYLVLDYADGGDLFESLEKYKHQDELIKEIFLQLLDAVQYCHDNGVYHRDLKPENILLKDERCLLADFGLSSDLSRSKEYGVGSLQYMSPELVKKDKGDWFPDFSHIQSDIWALGVILCRLITPKPMWRTADPLSDNNFNLFARNSREIKSYFDLSEEAYQVLRMMLAIDPLDRKPLHQIRQEVVLLTTFYRDRETVAKPRGPLTVTRTLSLSPTVSRVPVECSISPPSVSYASSTESEGPVTPETRPAVPPVEVAGLDKDKGEDMGTEEVSKLGSFFRVFAKHASGTKLKLDELISRFTLSGSNGISPVAA